MFADWFDWIMMLFGVISAIIIGCGLPLSMLVFGNVTNVLINLQVGTQSHLCILPSLLREN